MDSGDYREVSRYDEGRIIDQAAFLQFLMRPLGGGVPRAAEQAGAVQEKDQPRKGNLEQSLANAKHNNRLVFVNFTARTDTNCQLNENVVLAKPEVRDLLKSYEMVALYVDYVPEDFYSLHDRPTGETRRRDAQQNYEFLRSQFNTAQTPLYVILQPLRDGKYREVSRYEEGLITDPAGFVAFLAKPLDKAFNP